MLFLLILDERKEKGPEQAKAVGVEFRPSLEYPYHWIDLAAPPGTGPGTVDSQIGRKKRELQENTLGAFMSFVNGELIPIIKAHAPEIARAIEALKSKDLTARDPGVPSVTRAIRTNGRHRSPRQADP